MQSRCFTVPFSSFSFLCVCRYMWLLLLPQESIWSLRLNFDMDSHFAFKCPTRLCINAIAAVASFFHHCLLFFPPMYTHIRKLLMASIRTDWYAVHNSCSTHRKRLSIRRKNIGSRSARVQIHFEQITYMNETETVCLSLCERESKSGKNVRFTFVLRKFSSFFLLIRWFVLALFLSLIKESPKGWAMR